MYDAGQGCYIGANPIKWFRLTIWDMSVKIKAESRGAARYEGYPTNRVE